MVGSLCLVAGRELFGGLVMEQEESYHSPVPALVLLLFGFVNGLNISHEPDLLVS